MQSAAAARSTSLRAGPALDVRKSRPLCKLAKKALPQALRHVLPLNRVMSPTTRSREKRAHSCAKIAKKFVISL